MSVLFITFLVLFISQISSSPVDIIERYSTNSSTLSEEQFSEFFYTVFPVLNSTEEEEEEDDHDHDHDHDHDDEEEEEDEEEIHCESAAEVFAEFDSDASGSLNETELGSAIFEMMIMLLDGCDEDNHEHGVVCESSSVALAWLYGMIASVVISLLSLCGVVLLPLKGKAKNRIMNALIGLAVGALIGDAIIHIFPTILGVHSHSTEEEDLNEDESHLQEVLEYLIPCAIVTLSIVLFYFIEVLVEHFTGGYHAIAEEATLESGSEEDPSSSGKPKKTKEEIHSVGYMIIIVDAIHNFVDGLALGTAFITSPIVGLATAVAITLHELPQELGDFAVLLWAGFTRRQALGYNLLSSVTAIIGTGVGLALGDVVLAADKWILSVVAGSFLYIALGELVPHLSKAKEQGKIPVLELVLMLIGIGLMVALSFVELALEIECV